MKRTLIAIAMLMPIPAIASDYIRQPYNCRTYEEWTGRRTQECDYRWVRRYVPQYQPREYTLTYQHNSRGRGECLPMRAVVGVERGDLENAKANAISMWMEQVKLHEGLKYMNPDNAIVLSDGGRGPDCYASSTGLRWSEQVAEKVGRSLHQCEFRARPCAGPDESDSKRRR